MAESTPPATIAQLTDLRGLGPALAARLAEADIGTPRDLLYHFPREYTDRAAVQDIGAVEVGQNVTVVGTLGPVRGGGRGRWRRVPVTSTLTDPTGSIALAWFNQPYLARSLRRGQRALCTGRVRAYRDAPQLTAPQIEILLDEEAAPAWRRLLPSYRAPEGVSSRKLRGWIDTLLPEAEAYPDPLPRVVREAYALRPWADAMRAMHQPDAPEDHARARRRFVFEEFLLFQLRVQVARASAPARQQAPTLAAPGAVEAFQAALPFPLTADQERVWTSMAAYLAAAVPANVLLQGDVGTGKTLLALQAALVAIRTGTQVAFMAPTEVLVDQHAATVTRWLGPHGVECTTLTGGQSAGDRRVRRAAVQAGDVPLVLGTHALFDEGVRFARLGLVIIDEQHRFGVLQRARLQGKGVAPHLIVMTATPIPRTLALTLYGEFDRLTLRERPAGRQPVRTERLGDAPGRTWIDRVRAALAAGRQAYWVCPLVGPRDETREGEGGVAATVQFERLQRGPLRGYRLGLLHGGLAAGEKTAAMRRFAAGAVQVLVCTSVVEVGLDVPNASVMVIEDAHRFGLAPLHQLRGRLGRGAHPGLCLLRGTPTTTAGEARLQALVETTDGFEIATRDLSLRGPGDFLGVRQSGVPRLRLGHLVHDAHLMDDAAACARELLRGDPELRAPDLAGLRTSVAARPVAELVL